VNELTMSAEELFGNQRWAFDGPAQPIKGSPGLREEGVRGEQPPGVLEERIMNGSHGKGVGGWVDFLVGTDEVTPEVDAKRALLVLTGERFSVGRRRNQMLLVAAGQRTDFWAIDRRTPTRTGRG
jgi:hypothetical protein